MQARDAGSGAVVGRTRWRRFVGLLLPALTVLTVMVLGVLHGVLPVSAAVQGQQRIKITATQASALGSGSFPQFFQTQDGQNHTVVVLGLDQLRVQGLCASGRVDTPLGAYVVRITTAPGGPPLQVGNLQAAIEGIDGLNIGGQTVSLNRVVTAPNGVPVDSGAPGTLPINVTGLVMDLHANVRWVTVSSLKLSGVGLSAGLNVPECF